MALNINKLDLQEQEQLDTLKHFWERWGTPISVVLIIALLAFAGWRGYDWYQSRQASQAAALYEQLYADVASGDMGKLATSLKAMQDSYNSTTYAQQAGLLAGKAYFEKGKLDEARNALQAAAASTADKGLQSVAKLHLSSVLIAQKQYDQALQQLSQGMEPSYAALVADRTGDIYALQGKSAEAAKSYTEAYKAIERGEPYRQMIAMKLTALGVDVAALEPAAAPAAASAASAASPASSAGFAASAS